MRLFDGAATGAVLLLGALLAAAGCSGADRTGLRPPAEDDCESWLRLGERVLMDSDRDMDALFMSISDRGAERVEDWLLARASPRLVQALNRTAPVPFAGMLVNGDWVGIAGVTVWPLTGKRPESQSAVIPIAFETWASSDGLGIGQGVIRLEYVRINGEWRLDDIPRRTYWEKEIPLPIAKNAERMPSAPDTSPIVHVRAYAAGQVPKDVHERYAEDGIVIPSDAAWQDVLWRDRPLIYPGVDSGGRADPHVPGQPDRAWNLEELAQDHRLPNLGFEETTVGGRLLPTNPMTLKASSDADAVLIASVLRVMARPNILIRGVRVEVAMHPDDRAPSIIYLTQPLGWADQQSAIIVETGLDEDSLRRALGSSVPSRVGVRATSTATWQDIVTTFDALIAIGVKDMFFAVLPEGYEALH